VTLPSYYGDLVNGAAFDAAARNPDPRRLVDGYLHAAVTLNFIRSLLDGGFADLHHPEYWELGFMRNAGLPADLRAAYHDMTERLADGLRFMEAIGEKSVEDLTRVEFFTSHEGLNLLYESAQTRTVPRREGWFNLSTHLPWIGERTRAIDGAHVEYFRGIRNPVGVKIGPKMTGEDLLRLLDVLDPANEPGKMVLITRMGVANVRNALPPLATLMKNEGRRVLWVCDPMHGNPVTTSTGTKTRSFEQIAQELELCWAVLREAGVHLGGVHLEMTGEDVTECVGGRGGNGVTEADLTRNFASPCDPRLNYEQSMELAFLLARRMGEARGS
jgi:3-deoxy-7-phosphoheptulonate synthase